MKTTQSTGQHSHPENAAPYKILLEFLDKYEPRECHAELWRLLTAALSSEDADTWDRLDRGNAVFFCKHMDDVIRALFELKEEMRKNAHPAG